MIKRVPIKKRRCKQEGCTRFPQISLNGYCWEHASEEIKERIGSKRRLWASDKAKRQQIASRLHKLPTKLSGSQSGENGQKEALATWFKRKELELASFPYCQECNSFIPKEYYRHAIAHIFPKSENSGFPSVATHPLNYLFLGSGCGCHNKSHRLDTFSKMKVFQLAIDRFKIFELDIQEKRKYLDLFKSYIT